MAILAEFQKTSGAFTWVKKVVMLVASALPGSILPLMMSIDELVAPSSIQTKGKIERKAISPTKP
ncbi:hypothetical protein D9M70_484000 [compost metagenome]